MSDLLQKMEFPPELCTIYLRIAPEKFHTLKYILEGYDNWAVLSSTDNKNGIVRLKFSREMAQDIFDLLSSIARKIK